MTVSDILSFVRGSEYRKQLARLLAKGALADVDLVELLSGDPEALDRLLAAVFAGIDANLLVPAAEAAARHSVELGLARVNAPRQIAAARLVDVTAEALTQMETRVAEASRALGRMAATPAALERALQQEPLRKALLAPIESLLGSTGAGAVSTIEGAVHDAALRSAAQEDPARLFAWQTRGDDKVCSDIFENSCEPRHGEELPLDEWDAFGLPQGETLLCTLWAKGAFSNCRCVLESAENAERMPSPVDVTDAISEGKAQAAEEFERAA